MLGGRSIVTPLSVWTRISACAFAVCVSVFASTVAAQPPLSTQLVASGLNSPLEFVQDPSDPAVQYIVEQGGRIRVLANGALQPIDFLAMPAGSLVAGGEQGLLGLAFSPDYAASGRFYIYFTNPSGDLVVSRFRRSGNPLVADPGSRFDLEWSPGVRFIPHPGATNHNGGHLAFGPDGFLYISVGDGGGAGDTANNAQNLGTLLGKLLRIDVSVDDSDSRGFAIPPGNPFGPPARPEIWALGLRNPWKFSFDAVTGSIVIGDVGQGAREEIDFGPASVGGRNYGWRNREGSLIFDDSIAPTILPLIGPVFEYDRGVGRSVTGGYVYRGSSLGAAYAGRYFFADYVTRRVWSMILNGESPATNLREHTAEFGGSAAIGNISSFGVDAAGELYLVSHTLGSVFRIIAPGALASLDGAFSSTAGLDILGWAIDRRSATGSGVDTVHVYAYPNPGSGAPPIFLGAPISPFAARPDVAAVFGAQFQQSGFQFRAGQWVPPGPTLVVAHAHSSVSGLFETYATRSVNVVPRRQRISWVDQYPAGTQTLPLNISGWAIDAGIATAPPEYGTGVGPIFVDVFTAGGAFVQTVAATVGVTRSDIGSVFGSRYTNSGFSVSMLDLLPGTYSARLRYWMIAAQDYDTTTHGSFTVAPGPMLRIEAPTSSTVGSTFVISGWAIDLRATSGSGVNTVHVYAYPNPGSGAAPFFLGVATPVSRPDVGAFFGSNFTNSGYRLTAAGLSPSTYDIVVFARSTITMTFAINRVVRVTVQ